MTLATLLNFLKSPEINELMWNRFDQAFVERDGEMIPFPSPLADNAEFEDLIAQLAKLETATDGSSLSFDGVLPDGSRFHATRPPLSPHGPTLTIRKFSRQHRQLSDLAESGFLSPKLARFLEAAVRGRLNILISGAAGAGKTTLLNCLAAAVGTNERLITIEDIPEIQLNHPNWVRLLAVRAGEKTVSVRDCLVGSLRMRPDRILIGECRSSEALEMLQAMNTGHDGGMTTIHANSSHDALTRLESLLVFHAGAEIPLKPLRKQIVDALDLIVQIKRGANGRRYIEEVLEIVGMENDVITRAPLFKRNENARTILPTGHPPHFLQKLKDRGVVFPKNFFDPLDGVNAAS